MKLPARKEKEIKNLTLKLTLLILTIFLIGATSGPAAAPMRETGAAWKVEWDKTVEAAKKEGAVSVYSMWAPETRTALTQAFKQKYGINVEFTLFGSGAEITARADKEKKAGLNAVDVFGAGASTLLTTMKPAGLLSSLEPALVLPEVTEVKYWSDNKLPLMDKDKTTLAMLSIPYVHLVVNSDLVKKGTVKSYKDLLKPEYKGKITLNDPGLPGPGTSLLALLGEVWNIEETKDYLKQLIKKQDVAIQRDGRIHMESVARGKYAIGLSPYADLLVDMTKAGAPIESIFPREGVYYGAASGCIAVPAKNVHPNAAKVFINWLLSKEGQAIFIRTYGYPSNRTDVPTDGIVLPALLPPPGIRKVMDSEEITELVRKWRNMAKEIMASPGAN